MSEAPETFDDYLAYRFRMNELAVLHRALDHLGRCPNLGDDRRREEQVAAQRLAIATHLSGFFDRRHGLNVFEVWLRYFDHRAAEIETWRRELAPALEILRSLRNTAGAHADPDLDRQGPGRRWLSQNPAALQDLLERFRAIAEGMAAEEAAYPDLCALLNSYGVSWGALPYFVLGGAGDGAEKAAGKKP